MCYIGSSVSNDVLRARVENALEYVALMVAERDDGEAYLPIFTRLEEKLAALSEKESAVARAKRLAAAARAPEMVERELV
jgi:hypothetical protein